MYLRLPEIRKTIVVQVTFKASAYRRYGSGVSKVGPANTFHMACGFAFKWCSTRPAKDWITVLGRSNGDFSLLRSFRVF